jgi:NADPH2:quinone reductase
VRVRLYASGVNPSDVKSRAYRQSPYPMVIPHSDGAGEIDALGPGVAESRLGERVWVWNGQWQRPFGTAAEFIVLPAARAVPLPACISFEEGATLGIPASTAYHAVSLAGAVQGTTLLVSGGAGSVGQFAIQFAKARGATVITMISSPEKAAVAQDAGADHCINYKCEDVGARVAEITQGQGVDAIAEMDLTANAGLIPVVLRPKGKVIVYGTGAEATLPAVGCLFSSVQLSFFLIYQLDAQAREQVVTGITHALEQRRVVARIGPVFPLAEAATAHEAVERGTIGNVIVKIR